MPSYDQTQTADLLQRLHKEISQMRVLLIDRHNSARNSLRILLSTLNVTAVHNAASANEALRQVKANHFDIIFADYLLEDGRDSQQLLEELRQQRLVSLSTIYMLITAERNYHNVVSVAEFGPDDYLIKPFTAEQLQARLARVVYKKRFFAKLFEQLDRGAYSDALAICESLQGKEAAFLPDILRYKGEMLNILGRFPEAQVLFQQAQEKIKAPWTRMGLATALRGQGKLDEAEALGTALTTDFPEYLTAYDFVASVLEEMGKPEEAQEVLQRAAEISPNNSLRQRVVGDIAARNKDLATAERAYGRVFERRQGSSLKVLDDYANLSRTLLDNGRIESARRITQDLRRDLRGNKQGELAALVMDSLCAQQEGETARAKQALDKALVMHMELQDEEGNKAFPQKITVDLARACLATGDEANAQEILGRIAAENHENRNMIAHIESAFSKTGKEEAGQALLAKVGREVVEINKLGDMEAAGVDREVSLGKLLEAAKRIPSLQFLLNASNAVFTQLDQKGWNEDLAAQALQCLSKAQAKEALNPKVVAARELYRRTARKYGIDVVPLGGGR